MSGKKKSKDSKKAKRKATSTRKPLTMSQRHALVQMAKARPVQRVVRAQQGTVSPMGRGVTETSEFNRRQDLIIDHLNRISREVGDMKSAPASAIPKPIVTTPAPIVLEAPPPPVSHEDSDTELPEPVSVEDNMAPQVKSTFHQPER